MNSYPGELLAQHEPLMFAAGLDLPSATGQRSPPDNIPVTPNGTQTVPFNDPSIGRDPFVVLTGRLRNALSTKRKGAIWNSEKSRTFNVLLVDKVSLHALLVHY